MFLENGRLVVSPSDLVGYLYCPHLTRLSAAAARGEISKPDADDPELGVLQRRGIEHERAYLDLLSSEGLPVESVDPARPLAKRVEQTTRALEAGTDVIYQAAFFDAYGPGPAWLGYADFLTKVTTPSRLGEFSYEVEDTKLARHVRPSAVLQLCAYAEQLAHLQGCAPEFIHVVLGGQQRVSLRLADFGAYFRAAKVRFEEALTAPPSTYPDPVEHCAVCDWRTECDEQRSADDHLSLVPGLSSEQARKLAECGGVTTVSELAAFHGEAISGMARSTLEKLHRQARLLVVARTRPSPPPPYELLPTAEPSIGLGGLPEPDPGDLFFDIEGDPYVGDGGIEYLLGVGWIGANGALDYRAFWSHDSAGEKGAFEGFIDFVTERLKRFPNLHIYHYASYEPTALGRLMGRHDTREQEVDGLFRGGVLIDLYRAVRQGLCVGTPSYSLKKLEGLYMPPRTDAITDAGSSIVEYERWLDTGDGSILEQLETYNRVDCDSTRQLRHWLEERRTEYATTFGSPPPRPLPADSQPPGGVAEEISENEELRTRLADADRHDDPVAAPAIRLLGDLPDWYRREDKPRWWRYFDRVLRCDADDLLADPEAIAGLEYIGETAHVARSIVHRYRFDPDQSYKLSPGQSVCDPVTERQKIEQGSGPMGPGQLVSLDPIEGTLELQRGVHSTAPHPGQLIPDAVYLTPHQREALRRLARSALDTGIDGPGPYRATRDLLLRRPPRLIGTIANSSLLEADEDPAVATVRLAGLLDAGYLAVQGPPGSGKTSTAAQMVVELVRQGRTVGITANSHAVITHLLEAVITYAEQAGVQVRASQKAEQGRALAHPWVTRRTDNAQMAADLADGTNVLAGTAWLFSRPEFDQSLDYLVVDEAGQLSLANVCAVATAAKNLVLVGDPRQLSQPSEGTHPPGAGSSALEHLLHGAATIPPHLGIFLDHTYRLHPAICAFISEVVYDGRLRSRPGCVSTPVENCALVAG
jgi:predicted RecB family nuclease